MKSDLMLGLLSNRSSLSCVFDGLKDMLVSEERGFLKVKLCWRLMETALWLDCTSLRYDRCRLTYKGLVEAHHKRVTESQDKKVIRQGIPEAACVAPAAADRFGEIDFSIADLHSILLSL